MDNENRSTWGKDSGVNTANIMIAGKTGAGKSTLLNGIFGQDLAATGMGRPITDHIDEYQHESIPIHIWDTVGLELDSAKTQKSIDEIKRTIASRSESKDVLDQIHAIWYCINSGSNRYEGAELKFIKELYSIGVPFIIVLTQCYRTKREIAELEDIINKINFEMGMTNISIVRVLAQKFEVEINGEIHPIPSFGLEELVNATLDRLPDYVQSGFIAAQKVSESLKHEECEKQIWQYVHYVQDNHWSKLKIINWDNVPLINILTTDAHIKDLFKAISRIYNTEIPKDKLQDIMERLGSLSPENAFQGLLSPISKKFDENVKRVYNNNAKGKFDYEFDSLPQNQRVARMIVLYGYIFLESIEEYWEKFAAGKLDEMTEKTDELVAIIRKKCKEFFEKNR